MTEKEKNTLKDALNQIINKCAEELHVCMHNEIINAYDKGIMRAIDILEMYKKKL